MIPCADHLEAVLILYEDARTRGNSTHSVCGFPKMNPCKLHSLCVKIPGEDPLEVVLILYKDSPA